MTALRLSQPQTGIWFAQQRTPDSPALHCAEYVRIPGTFPAADLERLRSAVRRAVDETGTLTARFTPTADGVPQQILGATFDDPVRVVNVAGAPDPEAAALDAMRADVTAPLDLQRGNLCTAMVFTLDGADGVLLYLRAHHIVLDGYGFSAVIRRIAALYTASEAGTQPKDSPFAPIERLLAAEDEYRDGSRFRADREFWTDRMSGRDAPSPATRQRPAARCPAHRRGTLPAATARALDATAREHDLAWPAVLLAAAAAYTYKTTGAPEVTLGVPVLARPGAAAKVATTTVNVLALPLPIDPQADLASLARLVHDGLAAGRPHQNYRHEDLIRDLGLVGGSRRLFGPQVNIKPFGYPLRFGERSASVHYLEAGPLEDIELTVHTAAPDGALGFDLAANPDVYDADELDAHHERLTELVEGLADGGIVGRPVRRLDVTTAAERRTIVACNDTGHDIDPVTLPERFENAAARTPDAVALRFRSQEVTYRELDRRADRLAVVLRSRDGVDGGIVAVALERSADLVVALLAVLKAGAAYLPVDPDNPDDRIAYLLRDAEPECIVTDTSTAARLSAYDAATTVLIDDPDMHTDTATHAPDPKRRPGIRDRAYVLYTSGSTGRPKGVVVSHAAIVSHLAWMQHGFALGADDRVLQKTPCGFDVSVWEFFWPLLYGATLVLAEPEGHRDPAYLAETIEAERITTVHFVPSMLEVFLDEPAAARCATLRRVICSGEALGAELADRCIAQLDAPVFNLYGPTEAAVDVSWWRHEAGGRTVPIGHPVWNTCLHVLDDGLRATPPGVIGELYLAGTQLADGYLGRPELTAQRFLTDADGAPETRMYRTGDLARRRVDGAVEYAGRIDDQVKIRGVRIEPGEVAAALHAIAGVRRAAVVATEIAGATALVAYVVGDDPDPTALRRDLAVRLPAAMVPAHVVVLPQLPVTANGKLDKAALPAPHSGPHDAHDGPRSPTEQTLCEAFAEELGRRGCGATDDFFDLGGHSLAAARLTRRLREVLGVEVGIASIFSCPTPRALAEQIDSGTRDRSLDVLFPLRSGASERPLYCVHPAGGIGWGYNSLAAPLARVLPTDRPIVAVQARGLAASEDAPLPESGAPLPESIDAMAADYIDQIRATGDDGPYDLLGWSVGGVVAHAMAVQLQQSGAKVSSLTMLDAYPSDQWRGLGQPTEADALSALVRMAGRDPAELGDAVADRGAVIEALRSGGDALGSLGEHTLSAMIDIVGNNARLMREHRHGVYDGGLLFFTASAPREETWLDRDGWLPYVTGRIDAHDIDCTHPGMIRRDAMDRIAPALAERLAADASE